MQIEFKKRKKSESLIVEDTNIIFSAFIASGFDLRVLSPVTYI